VAAQQTKKEKAKGNKVATNVATKKEKEKSTVRPDQTKNLYITLFQNSKKNKEKKGVLFFLLHGVAYDQKKFVMGRRLYNFSV